MGTTMNLFFGFVAIVLFDLVLYCIVWIVDNWEKIIKKTEKCYEYIRQRICKKSNEVNDDTRTVYDGPEFYDSSSVWED